MSFTFDMALMVLVIIFIIVSLYKEYFTPIITFMIAIVALTASGILTPKEVLMGFANEQIAVIILLLIIGNIIQRTSLIDAVFDKVFNNARTYHGFLYRLMIYVGGFSAFLNNTPLVAMMMPYVNNWSRRFGVAPSKLLMPLSFAAILGGCVTLVGTSTNLLVNGMAQDAGLKTLRIFDFAWVGLPMVVVGFLFMRFIGSKLLPDNRDALSDFNSRQKEYLAEAIILPKCELVGKSVEEAGLRQLKGLFLVELQREHHLISPVEPNRILRANDRLIFAGNTDTIADLINSVKGLAFPHLHKIESQKKTDVVEVVIPHNSYLIGLKVSESNFRSRYDAVIIAIHRNGKRLSGKLGDVELEAGDDLLLFTGKGFYKRGDAYNHFYNVTRVKQIHKLTLFQAILLPSGLAASIALSSLHVFPLFSALLILLMLLVLTRIVTVPEIKQSTDFNLLAIQGMALGLGKAMTLTGLAFLVATGFIDVFNPLGVLGVLAGIFIITNLLSSFMTNVAAVSIVFPISYALGLQFVEQGLVGEITPFVLVVATGAAANFMTPIGYQTNLMVYGPGGYTFRDFMRVGLPLTFIYLVFCVTILGFVYNIF
ncbi:MAG: SLC13 family permease [Bacteroidetes bacterium]|nr:SLC13 family permease [Bacteroidota bacterium]